MKTIDLRREGERLVIAGDGNRVWAKRMFLHMSFLDSDPVLAFKCHRADGPAVERANGDKEWWHNGFLIRTEEVGD